MCALIPQFRKKAILMLIMISIFSEMLANSHTCCQVLFGIQQSDQASLLFQQLLSHSLIRLRSSEVEYKLSCMVLPEC